MEMNQHINEEEMKKWFEENIMQKIANKLGIKCENVILEISIPKNSFFLSSVYFVNIKLDEEDDSIRVVMKKPSVIFSSDKVINTEHLFHNEILFYEKVAIDSDRYPRCFYTFECNEERNNTVIITENIEYLGYKICPISYDIPFEYVIAGVQEIGRFHGMSYVMKTQEPERLFKIVADLKETSYIRGGWQNIYLNKIAQRPIRWLRKENYDSKFCDVMEKYMNNAFDNIMLDAIKPVEPLAVLCHGDFTRNNVFFKKSKSGLETMLIDFAMMRYASPTIDLSTYLYVSCSTDDRNHRFNEIFRAYHDSLLAYLNERKMKSENYSLNSMLVDYKRRVLFGYVIAVFFLPVLYGHYHLNDYDSAELSDSNFMADVNITAGGDVMSKKLAEMLLDLRNFGALDHIHNL